jgi:ABC-2 type transport system ATP-binding protein
MDEAERCHRLAYLAEGRLLATGTATEVVAAQRLSGYNVRGQDLQTLAARLRSEPGVSQVTAFGTTLHVVGREAGSLDTTASRIEAEGQSQWEPIEPGLEDVFISLMQDGNGAPP